MISVIIPFYNAKEFIKTAVESVLIQPEVGEIIIINDDPLENLNFVIDPIIISTEKIRIIQHADKKNHGASASRNLGVRNAKFELIAFLDADDFYLPNRFKKSIELLGSNENIDGIYEAIGTYYQSSEMGDVYKSLKMKELTTITEIISPEDLFIELLYGQKGYFSLDGLIVKKELIKKIGYFSENLVFSEDSEFILKLSAKGILLPGEVKNPVALRRVHSNNRITKHIIDKEKFYDSKIEMFQSLTKWGKKNISKKLFSILIRHNISLLRTSDTSKKFTLNTFFTSRTRMFFLLYYHPGLIFSLYFWKRLLPSRNIFNRKFNIRKQKKNCIDSNE